MSPEPDRARRHTARSVLRRIDDATVQHLSEAAAQPQGITARLDALDREWDLDRTVETEAAAMGLTGLALAAALGPRWLLLPGAVGLGVFAFATLGLYPLLPAFRRAGMRTSREIERERLALKALRGDFAALATDETELEPAA